MLIRIIIIISLFFLSSCQESNSTKEQSQPTTAADKDKTYQWRLITTWPKNYPGLGTAPENLSKLVAKMSGGRFKIQVFGAGEIVPAFEVFDAVSQGTVEMGHGAAYYWRGKVKASAFFTAVPFGLTAQEMNGWLHYGGGMALWQELYEPHDLIPLASGNTGVQMAGWFNKEIKSVADLAGLKMRIPGLGGEVLKQAGGTPVTMPGSELYTAMQTGNIDATEWVGPYNDLAFGLHETAKYYYYPGWHEPGPTLEAIVNKKAWQALPEDLREILKVASRAINQDMLDEYTARNNDALNELVTKHKIEVRKLPDDVLAKLKTISDQVVADMAKENELASRIYQSYADYKTRVINYHRISEQAYINARDAASP